jgi:phage terminase large subunit GpA-like protein
MEMAKARLSAYHATGNYKIFEASTPTIKGASRIDAAFEAGDQRYWHVPCPHCHEYQRLEFGGKDTVHGLKFNLTWPYQAHYICKHCGTVIEHHCKHAMVMAGKWVASKPEPGRHPSYHIDALSSLLTTWDKIAEDFVASKDDPVKLKAFVNLKLGEAWEERGDAPEWDRLFARREDYAPRKIPPGGVIITGAADVQTDGVYYEVVAWGKDKQSWSIDIGFLEGDTADATNAVWAKLDQVYERRYPDAYGNTWQPDVFAVDSGFNTNTVYTWCRTRSRAMAIKGEDGWHKAAISSTPTKVDVSLNGRKVRRGADLWHVGTWSLKSELYAHLRKPGLRDGAEQDPAGFVHITEYLHDERWLKQVTAERISERESKGRVVKEWVASGPNHYHDCRIYNMALAVYRGVGIMTDAEWAMWEAERCRPPKAEQGDLLAVMGGVPVEVAGAREVPEPQSETTEVSGQRPVRSQFLPQGRGRGWLRR